MIHIFPGVPQAPACDKEACPIIKANSLSYLLLFTFLWWWTSLMMPTSLHSSLSYLLTNVTYSRNHYRDRRRWSYVHVQQWWHRLDAHFCHACLAHDPWSWIHVFHGAYIGDLSISKTPSTTPTLSPFSRILWFERCAGHTSNGKHPTSCPCLLSLPAHVCHCNSHDQSRSPSRMRPSSTSSCFHLRVVWSMLVYNPVTCCPWSVNRWLFIIDELDFVGGSPVHITSGMAALAISIYLRKRKD